MKSLHSILVVLSAVFPTPILAAKQTTTETAAHGEPTDTLAASKCLAKSKDTYSAIVEFCDTSSKIYVPSNYAGTGITVGSTRVYIGGSCDPQAYVPPQYCYSQFFDMCVQGQTAVIYGHDGCQVWTIPKYA